MSEEKERMEKYHEEASKIAPYVSTVLDSVADYSALYLLMSFLVSRCRSKKHMIIAISELWDIAVKTGQKIEEEE